MEKNRSSSSPKFGRLRRKAEKVLQQKSPAEPPQSDTLLDLIQELHIHQVELEVQNEELQRAQHEITALQREYEDLYELAPCGYITLNNKGIITRINKTGVSILNAQTASILREGFSYFIADGYEGGYFAALKKAGESGHPQSLELMLNIQKDAQRWVQTDITADRDENEAVTQWRLTLVDISERKRADQMIKDSLQELEFRLRERDAIFRSVNEAILTVDNDMRVSGVNETAKTLCGIIPDSAMGTPFLKAAAFCNHACYEVLAETLASKRPIREYHLECHRPDHPPKPLVINSTILTGPQGEQLGAVLVIRDVSRISQLERQLKERHHFHNIIGSSQKMQEIYILLENLADMEANVLLLGESGTGKELVANALHFNSPRAHKPFVKVNCAALSENLLESELFGHVKGAFTGAVKDRIGRFQAADGGTLLLDEIGDLPAAVQAKLLRVLEEGEFEKVGDTVPIKVDVRLITATNKDLKSQIRSGQFRPDLYYRCKVVEITLPPLRDRSEDIPLLAAHFIKSLNQQKKKAIQTLSEDALHCFMRYPWPGNIRELRHALEHAFVVCRGQMITAQDLPAEITEYAGPTAEATCQSDNTGRPEIIQALEKSGWNKAKAARLLGIGRRTLYRKIHDHNIHEGN